MPQPDTRAIRFGVYEADVRSGELRKHGIRLRLQDQPFQVLVMLLERPGELVTREELRARLWPADTFVDFDHGLNTAVNKLREVLGDSAANPRFIETLARRGYRYVGPSPNAIGEASTANAGVQSGAEVRTGKANDSGGARLAAMPLGSVASLASAAEAISSVSDEGDEPLPSVPRGVVRVLLALAQMLYLSLYGVVLASLDEVHRLGGILTGKGQAVETLMLVTAVIGVPVRLYLLTAVAFDYRPLGRKFRRIFPLVLYLDFVFALTPYLITDRIGIGLATAACAALLYLPFSQRTLVRMGYEGIR